MLELEKVCLRCEGHGIVGEGDVCPECDGTGQVLTEDGKEVASLVHRFLTIPIQAQINRIDKNLAELRKSRASK